MRFESLETALMILHHNTDIHQFKTDILLSSQSYTVEPLVLSILATV